MQHHSDDTIVNKENTELKKQYLFSDNYSSNRSIRVGKTADLLSFLPKTDGK